MNRKWIFIMFAGWVTFQIGLFVSGNIVGPAVQHIGLTGDYRVLIQGIVLSCIAVPIGLYLYQQFYYQTNGRPENPVYSLKRVNHLLTGIIFVIILVVIGIILAMLAGTSLEWQSPNVWLGAVLLNILVAFLFEALPEELIFRGLIYDVLSHRLHTWTAVLLQTLLFTLGPAVLLLIQSIFGFDVGVNANIFYFVLLFFFGIVLQLIRVWTGSLWSSIGFHLAFLITQRFTVTKEFSQIADWPPIIVYNDKITGLAEGLVLEMMIIGGILILLLILGVRRMKRRSQNQLRKNS
ncbi:MAG TPA: type II CAAX endopeptidase family protein [Pseudogracilibacillus sp.]|nr:type II CAAX endopeptidase family protein [Pseudogracilibacillus sp.]